MSDYQLQKNKEFGFYSVDPIPSERELAKFYEATYYQEDTGQYRKEYLSEEIEYFQIECRILEWLYLKTFPESQRRSFLDVGCGEGYQADFFFQNKWQVTCVDYSDHGLAAHNPHLKDFFVKDNYELATSRLSTDDRRYSVILLKNVLEHVRDPVAAIVQLKPLMDAQTLLCVDVPNDYSRFQHYLLEKGYTEDTWFGPPQHLHYFQFESLRAFLESHGLEVVSSQAEFAIEQYVVNQHSNYAQNRELGREAHLSRCKIANFLIREGVEKFVQLRESFAALSFGRGISMIARLMPS